jgi:hypothetical protein
MGNVSKITDTIRLPITIEVLPYLRDHCFQGRVVLPAVESMRIICASICRHLSEIDIRMISGAQFIKFLFLRPHDLQINAFTEIGRTSDGQILGRLITRHCAQKGGYARLKEHAVCRFGGHHFQVTETNTLTGTIQTDTGCMTVSAKTVYRELVPFGPCYHNLTGNLSLSRNGVEASIRTPEYPAAPGPLGSPFALDAAFHAACVWGQRHTDLVGFPVGIEKRIILHPTQPGQIYQCRVVPVQILPKMITFNIRIYNHQNELFESIQGVEMRDVSNGKLKPPAWLHKGA